MSGMVGNYPDRLIKLAPLLGDWRLDRLIGAGTFGRVYRVVREELGEVYEAALKWIPLPKNESEMSQISNQGIDASHYYRSLASNIQTEVKLLRNLRVSNVVSYEDHIIRQREDGIGWDVLIRMELLTSLNDYFKKNKVTTRDVVQLGVDVCAALEACRRKSIIHRDIKPDNIFIAQQEDGVPVYKLGDFGIARQMESTLANMSIVGTYNYMAPEIYRGDEYGGSVDLYSLGMVMYRMLNNLRDPFLTNPSGAVTPAHLSEALKRRMSGEPVPRPAHCDGRLWEVIRIACAVSPEDRYKSPLEMRDALQALPSHPTRLEDLSISLPNGNLSSQNSYAVAGDPSNPQNEIVLPLLHKDDDGGTIALGEDSQHIPPSPPVSRHLKSEAYAPPSSVVIVDKPLHKRIRKKKRQPAVAVLILIFLACVAVGGGLWQKMSSGGAPYDVTVARAAETFLTLSWADTGWGPWEVYFAPEGVLAAEAQKMITSKRDITLNKLIPGTNYKISVAGASGEKATISAKTAAAQRYVEHNTEVSSIELHTYEKNLLGTMDQTELVQNHLNELTEMIAEGDSARLLNAPMDKQNNSILLVYTFTCDQTPENKHYNIQTVIRQDNSRIFVDDRLFERDGQKLITSYYLDLQGLLAKLWDTNGRWPSGNMGIEVYVNGSLLTSVPLRIETVRNE